MRRRHAIEDVGIAVFPDRPSSESNEKSQSLAVARRGCMKSGGPPVKEIYRAIRRLDGEAAPVQDVMPDGAGDDAADEKMVHGIVLLVAEDTLEVVR